MIDYFVRFPGTPTGLDSSVHYSSTKRIDEAKKQQALKVVNIKKIIDLVKEFLGYHEIETIQNPILEFGKGNCYLNPEDIDYEKIQQDNGLEDCKDIVWIKFTKDNFIGVVAQSDDINFDIPKSKDDYNLKEKGNWKHTTSGIIIHRLGKEWDESFVLLFPLRNIPIGLNRHKIETAIGNYLIEKGVPILDFYSHNY